MYIPSHHHLFILLNINKSTETIWVERLNPKCFGTLPSHYDYAISTDMQTSDRRRRTEVVMFTGLYEEINMLC